jgi:hypothetical protein
MPMGSRNLPYKIEVSIFTGHAVIFSNVSSKSELANVNGSWNLPLIGALGYLRGSCEIKTTYCSQSF